MDTSLVPMPEKKLVVDTLVFLEEKKKVYESKYQVIKTHKFINKVNYKSKVDKKITSINEVLIEGKLAVENTYSIKVPTEILDRLSENLSECLKHIKEITQDSKRGRQKISSALGKLSASIQNLLSNFITWNGSEKMQDLTRLSLLKILEIIEELINNSNSLEKEVFKTKLTGLRQLFNKPDFSLDFLFNLIINKYLDCNKDAKKSLNILSNFFINDKKTLIFFKKHFQ